MDIFLFFSSTGASFAFRRGGFDGWESSGRKLRLDCCARTTFGFRQRRKLNVFVGDEFDGSRVSEVARKIKHRAGSIILYCVKIFSGVLPKGKFSVSSHFNSVCFSV